MSDKNLNHTSAICDQLDTCVQSVIGGVGGLVALVSVIIFVSIIIVLVRKRRNARHLPHKQKKHGTSKNVSESNTEGLNQTEGYYTRERDGQQSSHDYDSIHMSVIANNRAMMSPSELEKGGRYIHVQRQDPELDNNDYAKVGDRVQSKGQAVVKDPAAHGYDVPKPVSGATQASQWDGVQSYETPESVVNIKWDTKANTNPGQVASGNVRSVQDTYDKPEPKSSYANITEKSATLGRKVSNTSASSFASAGDKRSAAKSISKHGSVDCLQRLPADDLPEYVNVKKGGFLPARILSSELIGTVRENPTPKPKPLPQVKMVLKPALPSQLFKPTPELSQILESNRSNKEQKSKYQPLTPVGMETKPAYTQASNSVRSQTWTMNENVTSKTPRKSNYTPIDVNTMDPNSDYQHM